MINLCLILSIVAVGLSNAAPAGFGGFCITGDCRSCPNASTPTQFPFDETKYAGVWYVHARLPGFFAPYDSDLTCENATYTIQNGTTNVNIFNQGFKTSNKETKSISGVAVVTDPVKDPSKLSLTLKGFPFAVPYWIMATDYETYALSYGCSSYPLLGRQEEAFIMSRNKSPMDKDVVAKLTNLLKTRAGVDVTKLVAEKQDC